MSDLNLGGVFHLECRDPTGRLRWSESIHNAVTSAGLTYAIGAAVAGTSQLSSWYIGLIDSSGYSRVAAGDTAAAHGGWTEATAYSESARQAWTAGSVSAGAVDNSASPAVFTASGALVVKGLFLVSNSTKSGTTGTLFSTAVLPTIKTLAASDTLTVSYNLQALAS